MVQRLAAAALLTLVVAGCGASDEQKVRKSVTKFAAAVADGNPGRACDLVVKSSKDACENTMTSTILDLDDQQREALHHLEILKVRVVGAVAQVQLRNGGGVLGDSVTLRRQKRKWRIVKP